jgi:hypothetical protein
VETFEWGRGGSACRRVLVTPAPLSTFGSDHTFVAESDKVLDTSVLTEEDRQFLKEFGDAILRLSD